MIIPTTYCGLSKRYHVLRLELMDIDCNSKRFIRISDEFNEIKNRLDKFNKETAIKTFNSRSGNYVKHKKQIMNTLLSFFK